MITEILMPKYGYDTEDAKLVKWLIKEGDVVTKGEPLFILETTKVTGEVPALESGILSKIIISEGETVNLGELVGIIADEKDKVEDYLNARAQESVHQLEKTQNEKPVEKTEKIELKISPIAKRLVKEYGINMQDVFGTGPGGRITKQDVLKHIEKEKEYEVIPLTGMRKIISDHMIKSVKSTARVTQFIHINLSKIIELRKNVLHTYQNTFGIHLTYSHIFAKAVAQAIKNHPYVNTIFVENEIRLMKNINLGIAVDTNEGLIVIKIENVGDKSLNKIASEMTELTEKARQGKLTPEETSGSTFTISNAGVFGIDFSTPIINTPQTAILGIGTIAERPVVIDGEVVARPTVYLSFSYDHRIIDGAPAARFLLNLKQILENPSLLNIKTN